MAGVVDNGAVEEDEVLIGGAAPDIESVGSLSHRLDAGQGHHHLEDITLSECHRNVLYGIYAYLLYTHLGYFVAGLALRGDNRPGQGEHLLLHIDVESAIRVHHQGEMHVFEGVPAEIEAVFPGGEHYLVESESVGNRIDSLVVIYRNAGKGLAGNGIADIACNSGTTAPSGTFLAYFVTLVLERGLSILLSGILEQAAVVRGTFRKEITCREVALQSKAGQDKKPAVILGNGISAGTEAFETLIPEGFRRRSGKRHGRGDREEALVGCIFDTIDWHSAFRTQESGQ